MRQRDESGESLVEIVIAIVIIGFVVSAYLASLATSSTSSKTHRDLVTADAVLRDYAEATKGAVRASCIGGATTYAVSYSSPSGFTPLTPTPGSTRTCPSTTAVSLVHLAVTLPNGSVRALDIDVRAP
jgi:type II secretory pathway pseudopilin PulG